MLTSDLETITQSPPTNQPVDSLHEHLLFSPTEQQAAALVQIEQFISNKAQTHFLLGGYAGTGKSSIIFAVVHTLLKQGKTVALSAPTNKAVGVLRKMAAKNGIYVHCTTIHSLLGLALVTKGEKRVLDQVNPSSVYLYDVVVCDECSMVSKELWEWLQRTFTSNINQRKLILMGDPAQLNPIGEKRSPTFKVTNRAILTQVVRQPGESPLLDFVTQCRQSVQDRRNCFEPFSNYNPPNKLNGAFKVSRETLVIYAIKKITKQFALAPDYFRILCYRNDRVKWYNQVIREAIYGRGAAQFVPGERLIAKSPVVGPDGKEVIFPTSTEVTVTETTEGRHYGYKVWQLQVTTDEGLERQIFALHSDENERYNQELESKRQKAAENRFLWRAYYRFRDNLFANVQNCYALTIHNSQGSTFTQGAVDGADIKTRLFVGNEPEAFKIKEHNRLWYVAGSRFETKLLFVK